MSALLRCGNGVFGLPWLACALAGMGMAQAQTETVLHSFTASLPNGANPQAGVIRDSAGNLYGTTYSGGTANAGVVFKVNAAGHQTVLYSFTGGADGSGPYAGVIRDSAGNLYGTTGYGGTAGKGVAYKLDTAGQETVLYSFTGGADGANPYYGSVVRDSAGNLYGTTFYGGAANAGVVYMLDTAGHETVLYSFTGGADGGKPSAGVIRDSAGNLYGTTFNGGTANAGVVYKLDTAGEETVLYSFAGGADGGQPYAGVIRDSAGNLYGTTFNGGNTIHCGGGCGVVYKLDTAGQETVLHSFAWADGSQPKAGVIRDSAGNLYGTTSSGGAAYMGVVYKLDTAGQETVLHSFTWGGADGVAPFAGVIRDAAGNVYGTTPSGGPPNAGVVFKLDASGHETVLYSFTAAAGGSQPISGVIRDSAGNLYGTTFYGGPANAGVVYKLNATGHETVLYSFTGGADGQWPNAGVLRDSAGNLYGTTYGGGTAYNGAVYKLDTTGHETVLYSFTGGADGGNPFAGVIRDSAGNLYGTTSGGGTAGAGVVYKLDTAGHETVLHSFTGGADGQWPNAGVIRDSAGNLYGTTAYGGTANEGVVFKVDTTGQETVLYGFTGGADGGQPFAGVIRDSAGNLYGTTYLGGAADRGVVYKLDTGGHETVLYSFTGGADGSGPYAGVIRDSAGNLYGTTGSGAGPGVVYKLDTAVQETVLYSFTGGADGGNPSGVIRDSAGNLYGTTSGGGTGGGGVVFKLTP
jgi:uncharacterized repeat protein (TIGR03803 family)